MAQVPRWYHRFRVAAVFSGAVAVVWTLLMLIPIDPFDDLLSVVVGGGAGTWFVVAYLVYLIVGVAGFSAVSSMLATVELAESRVPDRTTMTVGSWLLFAGVNVTCILLGIAGGTAGYAQIFKGASESSLSGMLSPYLDVLRVTAATAAFGGLVTLFGIVSATGKKQPE